MSPLKKFFALFLIFIFAVASFLILDIKIKNSALAYTPDLPPVLQRPQPQQQNKSQTQNKTQNKKSTTNTKTKKATTTTKQTKKTQTPKPQAPKSSQAQTPAPAPAKPKPFIPEEALLESYFHFAGFSFNEEDKRMRIHLHDRQDNTVYEFPVDFDSTHGGFKINIAGYDEYNSGHGDRRTRILLDDFLELYSPEEIYLRALNNKDSVEELEDGARLFKSGTVVEGRLTDFIFNSTLYLKDSSEDVQELFAALQEIATINYKVPQSITSAELTVIVIDLEGWYEAENKTVRGGEKINIEAPFTGCCRVNIYLDDELVWWKLFNVNK